MALLYEEFHAAVTDPPPENLLRPGAAVYVDFGDGRLELVRRVYVDSDGDLVVEAKR